MLDGRRRRGTFLLWIAAGYSVAIMQCFIFILPPVAISDARLAELTSGECALNKEEVLGVLRVMAAIFKSDGETVEESEKKISPFEGGNSCAFDYAFDASLLFGKGVIGAAESGDLKINLFHRLDGGVVRGSRPSLSILITRNGPLTIVYNEWQGEFFIMENMDASTLKSRGKLPPLFP